MEVQAHCRGTTHIPWTAVNDVFTYRPGIIALLIDSLLGGTARLEAKGDLCQALIIYFTDISGDSRKLRLDANGVYEWEVDSTKAIPALSPGWKLLALVANKLQENVPESVVHEPSSPFSFVSYIFRASGKQL
jgi:hypothetical protein